MSTPPLSSPSPPKVGDLVIVSSTRTRCLTEANIRTITAITPAEIILEGYRFNKVSLKDRSGNYRLEIPTKERLSEVRTFHLIGRLMQATSGDWRRAFSEEQLAHLVKLLNQ